MKSDLEIAQEAKMLPIIEIAKSIGLEEDDLELYGKYKAKISLDVIKKFEGKPNGKYIDVTAITPTPLGEGKTVTTIGLSQALGYIGKRVFTCIRPPSLGPVFGIQWRRVVDVNDRWALDEIEIGLGEGVRRKSGFDISVASELMAILGLTSD